MMRLLQIFLGSFVKAARFYAKPFRFLYVIPMKVYRKAMTFLKKCIRAIIATPRKVLMSPVVLYRKLAKVRDWIFAKIEYLNAESKKWATVFKVIMSPYSLLLKMGFSPNMAISFLAIGGVATTGVAVNETVFSEDTFENRSPGQYFAPSNIPSFYALSEPESASGMSYNTLRISLSSTAVDEIDIRAVSLGTIYANSALPQGATTAVDIGALASKANWLEVGEFTIDGLRCQKLRLHDIDAHTINIIGVASDGQSISPSPGSGVSNRMRSVVGGNHMAAALRTEGGTYDRLWIEAAATGTNGRVNKITLTNIYTKGGLCRLGRMKVGTLNILNSEIGNGDGLAAKDFIVETTVTGQIINANNNVEVLIAEPVTITN